MHLIGKLALLSVTALAALAFTAGTASAQEAPVEVMDEATGVHCNPCPFHMVGFSDLWLHVFGHEEMISACTDEFEGEIHENGDGHITSYTNNHAADPATCTTVPCAAAAEREWPITNMGEIGPEKGHMDVRFCVRHPNEPDSHCPIEMHFYTNATGRVTEFGAVGDTESNGPTAFGARCELDGHWTIETGPVHKGLEVNHL